MSLFGRTPASRNLADGDRLEVAGAAVRLKVNRRARRVSLRLDRTRREIVATASVGSNAWSLPATLVGSGTLKVQVVDLAGNIGPVYAHAYTLDTTAPAAPSK